MGFTLTMMPLASFLADDRESLRSLLIDRGVSWNDEIKLSDFEGKAPFETDEEDGEPYITHWEVGWSWWSKVQRKLMDTLGAEAVPTSLHIHAWNGVAIPGDIEDTMLGSPRRLEPRAPKGGLLKKIFGGESDEDRVQKVVDQMVLAYGGPYANLMVVSLPRLVAELKSGIDTLGYDESEMWAIYDTDPDDDDEEVAKCYMLMAHAFLRGALEQKHLAWFIK
jgi:hypothetical protein